MKVIVISGASSHVGKTALARSLQRVLAGAEIVKIGHGRRKAEIRNHFYEVGTPFSVIRENHAAAPWLLVESNSVLREIHADLVIYLEGPHPKPSAEYARQQADIVPGRDLRDEEVALLAARLDLTLDLMRTIIQLAHGASRRNR